MFLKTWKGKQLAKLVAWLQQLTKNLPFPNCSSFILVGPLVYTLFLRLRFKLNKNIYELKVKFFLGKNQHLFLSKLVESTNNRATDSSLFVVFSHEMFIRYVAIMENNKK